MTGAEDQNRCNSFEEELGRVDPQREQFLLGKIRGFLGKIKSGDKVLIACHPDADGFVSGTLLKAFVDRFFEGKVQTEFCTDTLETQAFYDKAKSFKHVITGDLWVDEKEEKQQGLRALLEQGANIAVFDHHDKEFTDLNPPTIEDMKARGMNRDRLIPETLNQDFDPQTRGDMVYVSPKRLGFHNPDPNKFTGGLIVYKMLSQLTDLSDLEFLLPISAKGDCDAGKKYWPKLVEKYAGHDSEIADIAGALNLGKNLKPANIEKLITRLMSVNRSRNPYEEIEQDSRLSDLKILREHIRRMLSEVLDGSERIAGRFLYYHVTAEEEQKIREGLNGDLNPELELDVGLSEALCEQVGKEITVVVTQPRKGIPEKLHACFKDDRDDYEYDVREIAKLFGGGGHENASGTMIELPIGWGLEAVIGQFRRRLQEIAESY